MRNKLIPVFFFASIFTAYSQKSNLKLGVNFNADIVSHEHSHLSPDNGKVNYPSFQFSFERTLNKRMSILGSLNYAQRNHFETSRLSILGVIEYDNAQVDFSTNNYSFILSSRYYFKETSNGFFIELGIPLTYSNENIKFNAGDFYHKTITNSYAISTIGGIGLIA